MYRDMKVNEVRFVFFDKKPMYVQAVEASSGSIVIGEYGEVFKCEVCVFRDKCLTAAGIHERFNAVGACFAAGRPELDEVYFIKVEK